MRLHWLDNVRWATVLLVLAYHVGYFYNGVGILGAVGTEKALVASDAACAFVYPWFMVLLFVVSGMSSRLALQHRAQSGRGDKGWLRDRAVKLLVPSTLGLFVLQWTGGWLNIYLGGGLPYIPGPLVYPIAAIAGIGPLWFAQVLFVLSCVLVLLRRIDHLDRAWRSCGAASGKIAVLVLLALAIWAGANVLNLPVLTTCRFGIYGVAYFAGYLLLSHERAIESLGRATAPLMAAALCLGAAFVISTLGSDYTATAVLKGPLANAYAWVATLAVLGAASRWANADTPATRRLASSSFGLYVVHYPVMIWVCYALYLSPLPAGAIHVAAIVLGIAAAIAAYEALRQIPVVRWLVLGMHG